MRSARSLLTILATSTIATIATAAPCPPKSVFDNYARATTDGKLAFCVDDTTCWVLDVATSTWAQSKPEGAAKATVDATQIQACAADGKTCDTLATKLAIMDDGGQAIANADRSLVAVWAGPKLDVWDMKAKKVLAHIKGWKSPMGPGGNAFQQAQFVGTSLIVWESWTPVSSAARIFDARTGKFLANVVKAGMEVSEGAIPVGKNLAFLGFNSKLYLVDPKTGIANKSFVVNKDPGNTPLAGKIADGRIAIVFESAPVLVEPTTGAITKLAVPACAK